MILFLCIYFFLLSYPQEVCGQEKLQYNLAK